MVLSPKEALGNKRQIEANRISELIKKVDTQLEKEWDGRKSVNIYTSDYSQFVQDEVMTKYRSAGWHIEYHSATDQRDDSYYIFKQGVVEDRPQSGA